MKYWYGCVILFIICFCYSSSQAQMIRLRSGVIDTTSQQAADVSPFINTRGLSTTDDGLESHRLFFVTFSGPLTDTQKSSFSQLTGEPLGEYIPDYSYRWLCPSDRALSVAKSFPGVQWIGDTLTKDKLSPELYAFVNMYNSTQSNTKYMELEVELYCNDHHKHLHEHSSPPSEGLNEMKEKETTIQQWKHYLLQSYDVPSITIHQSYIAIKVLTTQALAVAEAVATQPSVTYILPVVAIQTHDYDASWVCQSNVQDSNSFHVSGLTGAGQSVNVIDTGLDVTLCAYADSKLYVNFGASNPTHRKILRYDSNADNLDTVAGHGTHVSGSIVANDPNQSKIKGIAYDSKIAFFDVGDSTGALSLPSVTSDMISPSYSAGARITNISWGCSNTNAVNCNYYSSTTRSLDMFAWNYPDHSFFIAAGNYGEQGARSVGWPATLKNGLSVGASLNAYTSYQDICCNGAVVYSCCDMIKRSSEEFQQSHLAHFSSLGPALDGRIKPDIVAPGSIIRSQRSGGGSATSSVFVNAPTNIAGNSYAYIEAQGWGKTLTAAGFPGVGSKKIVLASPVLADSALTNAAAINGNIALIIRGSVEFGIKALAAQNAGAIACIIYNNSGDTLVNIGAGTVGASVTIPVVFIGNTGGALLASTATTTSSSTVKVTLPTVSSLCKSQDVLQMNGTSMASPIAAGIGVLTRQYFTDGWYPAGSVRPSGVALIRTPSAALIRSVLLHGALKMTGGMWLTSTKQWITLPTTSPNTYEGFGRVYLAGALKLPSTSGGYAFNMYADDVSTGIVTGQSRSYTFLLGCDGPFTATLAWTDYPSSLSAAINLVNDLDLSITYIDGNQSWPTTVDRLNNNEKILLPNAVAGTYKVTVTAFQTQYAQSFALFVTGNIVKLSGDGPSDDNVILLCDSTNKVAKGAKDFKIKAYGNNLSMQGTMSVAFSVPSGLAPYGFSVTKFETITAGKVQEITVTSADGLGMSKVSTGKLFGILTSTPNTPSTSMQSPLVSIATVVDTPSITPTSDTVYFVNTSVSLVITGTNFSTTPLDHTVTLTLSDNSNRIVVPSVSTPTQLTMSITLPSSAGTIYASLTAFGVTTPVVTVGKVVFSVSVTSSTSKLSSAATSLIIQGSGFSSTPSKNTIKLYIEGSTITPTATVISNGAQSSQLAIAISNFVNVPTGYLRVIITNTDLNVSSYGIGMDGKGNGEIIAQVVKPATITSTASREIGNLQTELIIDGSNFPIESDISRITSIKVYASDKLIDYSVTVKSTSSSQIILSIGQGNISVGNVLNVSMNVYGGDVALASVGTVVSVVSSKPTIQARTDSLSEGATQFTIYGTGFSTTSSNVVTCPAISTSLVVSTATTSVLTVKGSSGMVLGKAGSLLSCTVKSNNLVSTAATVSTIVALAAITPASANYYSNNSTIQFNGKGFSSNAFDNIVTITYGSPSVSVKASVYSATTSLIQIYTSSIPNYVAYSGTLMAQVYVFGGNSTVVTIGSVIGSSGVTPSSTYISIGASSLTITGYGFPLYGVALQSSSGIVPSFTMTTVSSKSLILTFTKWDGVIPSDLSIQFSINFVVSASVKVATIVNAVTLSSMPVTSKFIASTASSFVLTGSYFIVGQGGTIQLEFSKSLQKTSVFSVSALSSTTLLVQLSDADKQILAAQVGNVMDVTLTMFNIPILATVATIAEPCSLLTNASPLGSTATQVTISGYGFSATPALNTIVFSYSSKKSVNPPTGIVITAVVESGSNPGTLVVSILNLDLLKSSEIIGTSLLANVTNSMTSTSSGLVSVASLVFAPVITVRKLSIAIDAPQFTFYGQNFSPSLSDSRVLCRTPVSSGTTTSSFLQIVGASKTSITVKPKFVDRDIGQPLTCNLSVYGATAPFTLVGYVVGVLSITPTVSPLAISFSSFSIIGDNFGTNMTALSISIKFSGDTLSIAVSITSLSPTKITAALLLSSTSSSRSLGSLSVTITNIETGSKSTAVVATIVNDATVIAPSTMPTISIATKSLYISGTGFDSSNSGRNNNVELITPSRTLIVSASYATATSINLDNISFTAADAGLLYAQVASFNGTLISSRRMKIATLSKSANLISVTMSSRTYGMSSISPTTIVIDGAGFSAVPNENSLSFTINNNIAPPTFSFSIITATTTKLTIIANTNSFTGVSNGSIFGVNVSRTISKTVISSGTTSVGMLMTGPALFAIVQDWQYDSSTLTLQGSGFDISAIVTLSYGKSISSLVPLQATIISVSNTMSSISFSVNTSNVIPLTDLIGQSLFASVLQWGTQTLLAQVASIKQVVIPAPIVFSSLSYRRARTASIITLSGLNFNTNIAYSNVTFSLDAAVIATGVVSPIGVVVSATATSMDLKVDLSYLASIVDGTSTTLTLYASVLDIYSNLKSKVVQVAKITSPPLLISSQVEVLRTATFVDINGSFLPSDATDMSVVLVSGTGNIVGGAVQSATVGSIYTMIRVSTAFGLNDLGGMKARIIASGGAASLDLYIDVAFVVVSYSSIPSKPTSAPVITTTTSTSLNVLLPVVTADGGAPVTNYIVQYSIGSSNKWTSRSFPVTSSTASPLSIAVVLDGLSHVTVYYVRYSVQNRVGVSAVGPSAKPATTAGTIVPSVRTSLTLQADSSILSDATAKAEFITNCTKDIAFALSIFTFQVSDMTLTAGSIRAGFTLLASSTNVNSADALLTTLSLQVNDKTSALWTGSVTKNTIPGFVPVNEGSGATSPTTSPGSSPTSATQLAGGGSTGLSMLTIIIAVVAGVCGIFAIVGISLFTIRRKRAQQALLMRNINGLRNDARPGVVSQVILRPDDAQGQLNPIAVVRILDNYLPPSGFHNVNNNNSINWERNNPVNIQPPQYSSGPLYNSNSNNLLNNNNNNNAPLSRPGSPIGSPSASSLPPPPSYAIGDYVMNPTTLPSSMTSPLSSSESPSPSQSVLQNNLSRRMIDKPMFPRSQNDSPRGDDDNDDAAGILAPSVQPQPPRQKPPPPQPYQHQQHQLMSSSKSISSTTASTLKYQDKRPTAVESPEMSMLRRIKSGASDISPSQTSPTHPHPPPFQRKDTDPLLDVSSEEDVSVSDSSDAPPS